MALDYLTQQDPAGPIVNSLNPGDQALPDSVYDAYTRRGGTGSAAPMSQDRRRELEWAAEHPDQPHSWAVQSFDPDPFGEQARARAAAEGRPEPSSAMPETLVVAGKAFTSEELEKTENGRAILAAAIRDRSGHKRGFLDAVTDFSLTDIPFFGMFATVGGSLKAAKDVSDIIHKIDADEEITDDERLLLGRYQFESSRKSSVGGMIGDIVRAAPGFMAEFCATGFGMSAARAGVARAVGERSVGAASTLAVNRGTKILAAELAEEAVVSKAASTVARGAVRSELAGAVRGLDEAAKNELAGKVSTSIYKFVAETMGREVPANATAVGKFVQGAETIGGYSDEFIGKVADNIARKAVDSVIARKGASTAFNEWAVGFGQGLKRHAARAALDFGSWGTETSTMLDAGFNTWKSALADAVAATFLEAPIQGALMYLPKRAIANPLISAAVGGTVSQNQLSLELSSLGSGDKDLMEMARWVSEGMDLMEYVSENAGRGWNSGWRAAGLATGLAKKAPRQFMGTAGELLRQESKVEAGGFVRQAIRKAFGTTEQYAKRAADTEFNAVKSFLAREASDGVSMTDDAIRAMLRTRRLTPELAERAGTDNFGHFMKTAINGLRESEITDQCYRKYFHYVVADFMARNNFGMEQTMNAFQRMGYDGILGEMYEERYSDFFKGLLGLDDKPTAKDFRERVTKAFSNIVPEGGWDQLIAEAAGFAVPAVTRSAVLNVQRVLGSDSNMQRARAAGQNFKSAEIGMSVTQDTIGNFDKVMSERRTELSLAVQKAEEDLEGQRKMLLDQGFTADTVAPQLSAQEAAVKEAKDRLSAHDDYVKKTYEANNISDIAASIAAGGLMRFAVGGTFGRGGAFANKMNVFYTSEQLDAAQAAQEALLADAGFLGKAYDDARQFGLGDADLPAWRRIAAKTVGIAGALICGEPALAQLNSIKWASVDEGMDPHLAEDLGNLHRQLRERAVSEIKGSGVMADVDLTEDEIEARVATYGYEDQARDLVRNRLLLSGIRMFAHSEMIDRAAIHLAQSRGYYFDQSTREFVKDDERIQFSRFVEDNREAVDSLRNEIGIETLRLLTDNSTVIGSDDSFAQYVSYLSLKPGDPDAVPTARVLAAQLSGFGKIVTERRLAKGVPIETLLKADSIALSGDLVNAVDKYLSADPSGVNVPSELIEQLGQQMQYPLSTSTDKDIAERRARILETVRVAKRVMSGDVLAFQRHVDIGDSRLFDDVTRTVFFERNPQTGLWTTTDDVNDGKTNSASATWQGNDEQLRELVRSAGLVQTTRDVVLTQARALTTDDPILMLQKLGAAQAVMEAGRREVEGGYDYSAVHPALRINDATKGPALNDAAVERTLREELFKANFAQTHENLADYNFEKAEWSDDVERLCAKRRDEYRKVRDNVLGPTGYMTVIEKTLTAMHVDCPTSESLVQSALGVSKSKSYTLALSQYTGRHRDANYYVTVDYAKGIDPVASMVVAAVEDGLRRYGPRLFRSGSTFAKNAVQTFFRDLDQLVDDRMIDPDTTDDERKKLTAFKAAVTQSHGSPSLRNIALIGSALCCGQLARSMSLGKSFTAYDGALAILAEDAKNLGSYVSFTGLVDIALGGSGFSAMQARRQAGADPASAVPTGIDRIIQLTGNDMPKLSDRMAGMKPGRRTWADFERDVNQYAHTNFRETPSPRTTKGVSDAGADISEFGKLRKLFADAGFEDEQQIAKFMSDLKYVEPFRSNEGQAARMARGISNLKLKISQLVSARDERDAEVRDLQAQLDSLSADREAERQTYEAKLAEAKTRAIQAESALREAHNRESNLLARQENLTGGGITSARTQPDPTRAAINAGNAASMKNIFAGRQSEDEDEDDGLSVSIEDPNPMRESPSHVEVHVGMDENGEETAVVSVVADKVDLDGFESVEEKQAAINTVLNVFRAVNGADAVMDRGQFSDTMGELTGHAMPGEVIGQLWHYYERSSADGSFQTSTDGGAAESDTDGEEEGTHSSNPQFGNKYLAAFDNESLNRFLAISRYVAGHNGREFQAVVDGMRDSITELKEELENERKSSADPEHWAPFDPGYAAAVRLLDGLFNSETVTDDGIDNHVDRQALFSSRVKSLNDGTGDISLEQMIASLMRHGADGRPHCRQAAFFLSFASGMSPGNRLRFMTLACCSVSTRKISVQKTADGELTLFPSNGRYSSVSSFAAVGSFTDLVTMTREQVRNAIEGVESRMKERDADGNLRYAFNSDRLTERFKDVAAVIAPAIGHESPIVRALLSPHMHDMVRRASLAGRGTAFDIMNRGATVPSDKRLRAIYGDVPPMVYSVLSVLREYANKMDGSGSDSSENRNRALLSRIVTTEFTMGIGTTSLSEGNKDATTDTPWMWVLGMYSRSIPETTATAHTLPERNPRIASKVSVSLQDTPPAVRQFVDKDISDETSFAFHAYNVWLLNDAEGQGADLVSRGMQESELRQIFLSKVLPRCRQTLRWPDIRGTELLAKSIDRDYVPDELIEACANSFQHSWLDPMLDNAKTEDRDKWSPVSSSMFVPVYNGDHSAGVIMQVPTELLTRTFAKNVAGVAALARDGHGAYKSIADTVGTWLGMDQFGTDTKRSSLSCNEFPGRSMRAVKYVNGKLVKGETRVHLVHNYAMGRHQDALLGTTLAYGYGIEAQQDVAKDKDTETLKLHVMSATGTDLTMIKSLVTGTRGHSGKGDENLAARGAFCSGMATRALMDHIVKYRQSKGDADVSTSLLVDEDSMKVGVLNSKAMGVSDGKGGFTPLMRYIFSALERAGRTDVATSGDALDKALCDHVENGAPVADADGKFRFGWVEPGLGVPVRKTIAELLGEGVEVNVVDGLSGRSLDFSYVDNSLMSYAVANVAHPATPVMGTMARNNAVDGLTLATGMKRAGLLPKNGAGQVSNTIDDSLTAIAGFSFMAAVAGADQSNLDYARNTGTAYEMVANGAAPTGAEVTQQATRDAYKRLKDGMKTPLNQVAAPLVSCGGVYHEYTKDDLDADPASLSHLPKLRAAKESGAKPGVGEVVDHSAPGSFMNRLHQGSRTFNAADAAMLKTNRSLGYAHINMSLDKTGWRYGWFVNAEKLAGLETSDAFSGYDVVSFFGGDGMSDADRSWVSTRNEAAVLEMAITVVHRLDLAHMAAQEALDNSDEASRGGARAARDNARAAAQAARAALMAVFTDHHGRSMATYGAKYVNSVSFDDLFILRNDGTRGFDRAAFEHDMPDDAGKKGIWMAGTTFGIPRTPSYNGSMWCQTVRASTPCKEIETVGEDGEPMFLPMQIAMVMPDPQTLHILGCDHDGDKSSCYFLKPDTRTGTSRFLNPLDIIPSSIRRADVNATEAFCNDEVARRAYLDSMVGKKLLTFGKQDQQDVASGRNVRRGYEVSALARVMTSNTIVQGYLDMSRSLPVEARDGDFYGNAFAKHTKAQPLAFVLGKDDPRWSAIKKKSLGVFDFLKGSKIADSLTGAHVSTSAGIADKSRGMIVSWAGILHFAQFSGHFDTLFGKDFNFQKWVEFMYMVDGVSNATFDDIKEQICLRIGWTSGMIDTFLSDVMFSGVEPPTTSDEFFKILDGYVDSLSRHGDRFFMMIASEPSDATYPVLGDKSSREVKEDIYGRFGVPVGGSVRAGATKLFGFQFSRRDGYSFRPDKATAVEAGRFARALVDEALTNGVFGLAPEDRGDAEDFVIKRLLSDVSGAGGLTAGAGYVYSILNRVRDGADAKQAAKEYLRWSDGIAKLRQARDFTRSVNEFKADPGDAGLAARVPGMSKTFRSVMGGGRSDTDGLLHLMYAGNLCAYSMTNAATIQGRGVNAVSVRDDAIGAWATRYRNTSSPVVRDLITQLFAERGCDPHMLMQIEGNYQTIPFFLAALTSIPEAAGTKGLLTGNSGESVWDAMEVMARAAGMPGSSLGFGNAFCSLFGALYGLVSTSRQQTQFAGLSYLKIAPAGGIRHGEADDPDVPKYTTRDDDAEQLQCEFRDKDSASQQNMWNAVDDIVSGRIDTARRDDLSSYAADVVSFDLSVDNLRKFLAGMQQGKDNKLRRHVETAVRVLKALEELNGGKPVVIKPSDLFNQYFPVYATAVARSSVPDPKSTSVLNVVRGLYERLAARAAWFDSGVLEPGATVPKGFSVIDMLCSTDLALPLLPNMQAPAGMRKTPSLKGLDQAKVERMLEEIDNSGNDDGRYSYEDNETLQEILKFARGVNDKKHVRENPKSRHYIGFLEGTQLLRTAQRYINQVTMGQVAPDGGTRTKESKPVSVDAEPTVADPKEIDPSVKRVADLVSHVVAAWADVEYTGGNVFTIKSREGLTGSAATMFAGAMHGLRFDGAPAAFRRTDAVIQVTVGGVKGEPMPSVKVDVNSPAFAASFCNVLRMETSAGTREPVLTPEEFLTLTVDERTALVEAYCPGSVKNGVLDFSLLKPSWSVDAKGIATLCGQIHIGSADSEKKLWHEYFHSMLGMFRTMGVLGKKDVEFFRAKYGKAPRGADMLFDEEKAADAFADYVYERTHGAVPMTVDELATFQTEEHRKAVSALKKAQARFDKAEASYKDATSRSFAAGAVHNLADQRRASRDADKAKRDMDKASRQIAEAQAIIDDEVSNRERQIRAAKMDVGTRSIFKRIFDTLLAMLRQFVGRMAKYGFDYRESNADDVLFGMMINGYALQSNSRLKEIGMTAADADGLAAKMKFADGLRREVEGQSKFDRTESADPLASSKTRMYRKREFADPMAGHQMQSQTETAYHNALVRDLLGGNPHKPAVRDLVRVLVAIRTGNGKTVPFSKFKFAETGTALSVDVGRDMRTNGQRELDRLTGWSAATLGLEGESFREIAEDFSAKYGERAAALSGKLMRAGVDAAEAKSVQRLMYELASERNLLVGDRAPGSAPYDTDTKSYRFRGKGAWLTRRDRETVSPDSVGRGTGDLRGLFRDHKSIVVFDTETHGTSDRQGHVVQIAAEKFELVDGQLRSAGSMNTFVQLPDGLSMSDVMSDDGRTASDLAGGITDEQLSGGVTTGEALRQFLDLAGDGALLVAHNAQFDASMLSMGLQRSGMDPAVLDKYDWLDTLSVFRDRASPVSTDVDPEKPLRDNGMPNNKWRGNTLETAISHYGLDGRVVNDHLADHDTKALVSVLSEMDKERDDLPRYVNKFGYAPAFGEPSAHIPGVAYIPQYSYGNPVADGVPMLASDREVLYAKSPRGIFSDARAYDLASGDCLDMTLRQLSDYGYAKLPTNATVEAKAEEHLDEVKAEHPELPEPVARAIAQTKAASEIATGHDPVDRGSRANVATGPEGMLRAVVHAAQTVASEMDPDDLAVLSGSKVVNNIYERLNADCTASEIAKLRARRIRQRAEAAAKKLEQLTGDRYENPNTVNVLMHLVESGWFKDAAGRTCRQEGRAIYGAALGGSANAVTHAAKYASTASMVGAVLAAGGQKFGNVVYKAIDDLVAMRPLVGANNATSRTLEHVIDQLTRLTAQMDVTSILEDHRKWNFALDTCAQELFLGVTRGALGADGEFGDYENSDNDSEMAVRNRELYQFTSDPSADVESMDAQKLRQRMLKLAADAVFATAAQVKFQAEMGIMPGSIHHDAWTGKVTQSPLEFLELTKEFGLGKTALTSESPCIARWNDASFVAANLDDWYAGTVRETFGHQPIREMMLNESRRLRGAMSSLTRKVNFLAMKWGLNRAENRKLLKLKRFEATHRMDNGFIHAEEKGKFYEGFSNESGMQGDVTDYELTRDQYRDVQLQHQLAAALMNGDDRIITGIDKLTFNPQDFMKSTDDVVGGYTFHRKSMLTEADLSYDALDRRYDKTTKPVDFRTDMRKSEQRSLTSVEMALYRLGQQWQSSVTGLPSETGEAATSTIDLFSRLRKEILAAGESVFRKYEDARGELPRDLDPAVFNDEVLRILEGKNLIVATSTDDSKKDPSGVPLRTEGAICIMADDIRRMWDGSSAKRVLSEARVVEEDAVGKSDAEREALVDEAGKTLTADAIADELGREIVEIKRIAKEMPWLTKGDAKYLNKLDTALGTFEGTGTFMYHALRAERGDIVRDQKIKLTRHEMTWNNMLQDLVVNGGTYENLTGPQLRMIHDYFRTDEQGGALLDAMKSGKYSRGSSKSVRTGLVVEPGGSTPATSMHDVAGQIYRKQLERRLEMLEGRRQADFETEDTIGRMLQAYEQHTESGAVMGRGAGLSATQLYRMHGVLPANFTAGHAAITLMRGLQNSLYYRSAFTSMLFTPDADGDPVFFANPNAFRWDQSGLPDSVWATAAKWWASRLGPSVHYDVRKSGVENAKAIYDLVSSSGRGTAGTRAMFKRGAKRYATLGPDEIADSRSLDGFMAQIEDDDGGTLNKWGSARGLFSLDGSEALGYARHLFQTSRLQGGHMQWLNRIMGWSKTMSVSFSFFFPIATKWESPTAAVGALATMGSNWNPEFVRKHGEALSKIQKFFTLGQKEGWLDENFLGFTDVIRMMDTNDPFLDDLVMWAESVGISMTDRLMNPLEPNKGAVVDDLNRMTDFVTERFGEKAGQNFGELMEGVFLRQGEKAFTYALNATKLAVGAQVALRLKAEAVRQGKAFDPIRDMKGYAEYVDSEVGGVNPLRYAWAHPEMRNTLGKMWFSWEWTRTAWEAAGGGLIEDILFGGHAVSKGQKNVTIGRWLRMYGAVMIGFPMMLQILVKGLSTVLEKAFGLPPDDDPDRDKWFTFDNDSKIGVTAANITPFLKLVQKFDEKYLGGNLEDWKTNGQGTTSLVGAVAGGLHGLSKRGVSGAVMEAGLGAIAGRVAPGLLPEYTGHDTYNTYRNRQYFVHGGKQGWEVTRWFTDPVGQFFSKLSMPVQKLLEGVLGFNPGAPDFKGPMAGQSFAERWAPIPGAGSAWVNLLGMFRPFTMAGHTDYGDAGILSAAAPVQMGSSTTALLKRAEAAITSWANNDRSFYSRGGDLPNKAGQRMYRELADIEYDAKTAGVLDFDKSIVLPALNKVVPTLYRRLFNALPTKPDGDFDKREVERCVRALHRLGRHFDGILDSMRGRYERAGGAWESLGERGRRRVERILWEASQKPFGTMPEDIPVEKPTKMDY